MIVLYLVAAFAFFVWWVRGHFSPGAFLAFCSVAVILFVLFVCDTDPDQKDLHVMAGLTGGPMRTVWVVLLFSFMPYAIRRALRKR